MCEVCAAFGRGHHWTDTAGGLNARPESVDIRAYRADRRRVVGILNQLLAPLELFVQDWDGEAFTVSSRGGRSMQAANLSQVWQQVEKLHGSAFDPLTFKDKAVPT